MRSIQGRREDTVAPRAVRWALIGIIATFTVGAVPARATYPGTNGLIAFSLYTGSGFQINTIRPNGEGVQQLTSVTGSALASDWSPDGTRIVFEVDPSGGTEGCRIELMKSDGTDVHDITPQVFAGKHGCAWNPSFTPNGRRIVFVAHRCENRDRCPQRIWSMGLHGGSRHPIIRTDAVGCCEAKSPRVSPDGKTLLFVLEKDVVVQGQEGNRKALYSVRMNGTHITKIVGFRSDVCVCGGDWAPSGMRIVSSSEAGPTPTPGVPPNLFTVRPDGSHLRYVTHNAKTSVIIGVGSYSPNGRWIVYKRVTVKGTFRLMKVHPSGRDRTLITVLPTNFLGRDWGPAPG
jgi:Tol biopolymer transport system component